MTKLRRLLPLAALLALAACRSSFEPGAGALSLAVPTAHAPRVEPVDALHYRLELVLDPVARALEGRATVSLRALRDGVGVVELDLAGLDVLGVATASGEALEHTHEAGELRVVLPRPLAEGEEVALVVDYAGAPRKGLWFVGPEGGAATHVFTQGECVDSRWWFPCLDFPAERATSELVVDMPASWTSLAAGERVESREQSGRRVERWTMDFAHPAYLTTLVAGELVVEQDEWDGTPLLFACEPGFEEWMGPAFEQTDEALALLGELTGLRYPYSKYSQACVDNFPFGGMENISATTMTRGTLTDARGRRDRQSHGLVVHEAAHQWFGDLLTCRDWSHIWLNEGFATYMTLLYFERANGVDDFRVRMRDTQQRFVEGDRGRDRRAIVHAVYRDPMDLFFGGHTYQGGASVLHLLRFVLGDEAFYRGLRLYVQDNVGRGVVTADLRKALEAASGRDLERFFRQWLHAPGHPELDVRWTHDAGGERVRVTVEQLQDPGDGTPAVFHLPAEIAVHAGGETTVHRVELGRRLERFDLPCAAAPDWVRFDPHGWIPKEVTTRKPAREWLAIAGSDADPNGRRDAIAALKGFVASTPRGDATESVLAQLQRLAAADPVPKVREEAVAALGALGDAGSLPSLGGAAESDPEASVRAAALRALAPFGPDPALARLAERAWADGYSWDVMVAAAELRAAAGGDAFAWLAARVDEPSPHDRLRAGVLKALARLDDERVLPLLLDRAADPGVGEEARAAAVERLADRGAKDPRVRALLLELLDTDLWRLRQSTIGELGELNDLSVLPRLEELYAGSVHSRERRTLEGILSEYTR